MMDIEKTGHLQNLHMKLTKYNVYKAITIVFIFFAILYLVFSMLAPFKTLRYLNNHFQPETNEDWNLALINSETDSIVRSTAAINSKLILSGMDSISLSINLPDSTISLELQGVTIHTAKISRYKTSRLFTKINKPQFYKYLSSPFIVDNYKSSIVKVPIVVKHAPKDTAEANKQKAIPVIPREQFVRIAFGFDKPLIIILEQEEKIAGSERPKAFALRTGDRLKNFKETVTGIFKFRIYDYTPRIKIKIPRDEAKTIFRALPENAALTLEI